MSPVVSKWFSQVFPIRHLKVFTEEEFKHLLCGEHGSWNVCIFHIFLTNFQSHHEITYCWSGRQIMLFCFFPEQSDELLDNVKVDHGYTFSSPPVVNVSVILLIILDFRCQ